MSRDVVNHPMTRQQLTGILENRVRSRHIAIFEIQGNTVFGYLPAKVRMRIKSLQLAGEHEGLALLIII